MSDIGSLARLRPDVTVRRVAKARSLALLLEDWRQWLHVGAPTVEHLVGAYFDRVEPCVYFIESGEGGPIKIGVSSCVGQRMYDMQISNPEKLSCLLTVSGGVPLELMLHKVLHGSRIRGEWFRRSIELDVFIALATRPVRQWGRATAEAA